MMSGCSQPMFSIFTWLEVINFYKIVVAKSHWINHFSIYHLLLLSCDISATHTSWKGKPFFGLLTAPACGHCFITKWLKAKETIASQSSGRPLFNILKYAQDTHTHVHMFFQVTRWWLTSLQTSMVPKMTCRPSKKLSPMMMTVAPPVVQPSLGLMALMLGVAAGFTDKID